MSVFVPGIISGASGSPYATWSTTNKSGNITLSGGNLTFTGNSSGVGIGIATIGKSSGKWYWEVTINQKNTLSTEMIGVSFIIPLSGNAQALGAVSTNTIGWRGFPWLVGNNGTHSGSGSAGTTQAAGQVIGIALDRGGGTCAFYLNNAIEFTVTGMAAGVWYPACSSDAGTPPGVGTANFGNTPFVYTPPAGFNPGVYI